jgi:hypothetical protein
MSERKPRKTKAVRPLTIWDYEKYFDATFTAAERKALEDRLVIVCGFRKNDDEHASICAMAWDHQIFRPAQEEIWPALRAAGLDPNRDLYERIADCTLIHLCRQLEIDYKSFAHNVPKLPIAGFIAAAKSAFPEFRRPRNNTERRIQEHKLHGLWCDWHVEACPRTGCRNESHWLCDDRFAERDYPAILEEVARYNETRPKMQLVYSRD